MLKGKSKKFGSKSKISSDERHPANGLLVILSAPSGCGKTSIVDRLLKRHADWVRSVSVTTRAARSEEKEGEDYLFISAEKFRELERKGSFLESARVHGRDYGTPRENVFRYYENGKIVILAIDVQGMVKVKEVLAGQYPLVTLFVLPPSLKILRERLEGRKTETAQDIESRLQVAELEIKQADLYDYTVVNHTLEQTVLEIETLIQKSHKERS